MLAVASTPPFPPMATASAVEDAFADGLMRILSASSDYIDLFVLDANSQFGEKWHPTGSLLYIPIDHGFDIVDGNTGRLRERISLADVVSSQIPTSSGEFVDTLLVDSTGQNVVLITAAGVTYVQLDKVPLGIGSATPAFGGAGTVFTLRGSGFTATDDRLFERDECDCHFCRCRHTHGYCASECSWRRQDYREQSKRRYLFA